MSIYEEHGWDGLEETELPAPGNRSATRALDEEACPKCGGRMWDNRLTKRNPRAPDFKCRDRSCDGVIWPDKGEKRSKAPAPKQEVSIGDLPGDPAGNTSKGEIGPQKSNAEARKAFLQRHMACFEYVLEHYVPILESRNAHASEVDATLEIDLKGIAALTYQILRGQEDAR